MTAPAAKTPGRATIVILRPVDVVRAQFFDLDHHVRDGVHRGTSLRWTLRPPGERRLKQETRVLGRIVTEEFVIEDDAGKWVKRFVEGPNAGGKYVVKFDQEPHNATRANAEAQAPPKGFDNGLGKLSDLGVVKSLEKLLSDHQRALEGYEPGRVRGDVDKVLKALRDLTTPIFAREQSEQRAIVSNFLEAAAITAISDDVADDIERQTMKGVARNLCFIELDDAAIDRIVQGTTDAASADGIETRCDKIGARLLKLGMSDLGLAVAALIAQVSHGVEARELAALQRIARAAGVEDAKLGALITRVDAMLTTAPPA
jgi:tellurite resistance protein